MYSGDALSIAGIIDQYFTGIFNGDTAMLQRVFHPQAILFGDIDGQPYLKTRADYIEGVRNRKSPNEAGEKFRMKIIAIEVFNNIAYAKLHTPMFDFNYYDYLSLSKIDEEWIIVNKLFTNYNVQ